MLEHGHVSGTVERVHLSFYRISGFDGNGHDGPRHRRSQDAAGVFWNLLRHVLTEGRCQLTQHTQLKLNTQTVHVKYTHNKP